MEALSTGLVVGVIVVVIIVAAISAFYLIPSHTQSSTSEQTSSSTTINASSTTSNSSSITAASSNSSVSTNHASGKLLMEFSYPGTLVASPDLTAMNYSVTMTALGNVPSNLALKIIAPQGISAQFTPSNVTLGTSPSTTLEVSTSVSTTPGNYQLALEATGNGSTYNETATLQVIKYLVVTIATTFVPANLTVTSGSSVTWIRLNGIINQYDDGSHDVDFLSGASAVSPTLAQYQSWTYTLNQTGVYNYYCKFHPYMKGEIIVA